MRLTVRELRSFQLQGERFTKEAGANLELRLRRLETFHLRPTDTRYIPRAPDYQVEE